MKIYSIFGFNRSIVLDIADVFRFIVEEGAGQLNDLKFFLARNCCLKI